MLENRPKAQTAEAQFITFLSTLFNRNELVEVRAIKNLDDGTTRLVNRGWRQAFSTSLLFSDFRKLNENGANIYVGVNPRHSRDGTKQSVKRCGGVWVDIDKITLADAERRWSSLLPDPTLIVSSGHGVHLYWRLLAPVSVETPMDRDRFEAMLKSLYEDLGADSTQDVSRLLRLPGFNNVKRDPIPCDLVQSNLRKVPISVFSPWFRKADAEAERPISLGPSQRLQDASLSTDSLSLDNVRSLLASLDMPIRDRSRRDFAVVCGLLRFGFSASEIRSLVQSRSKFTTDAYTDTTIENAIKAVWNSNQAGSTDRVV